MFSKWNKISSRCKDYFKLHELFDELIALKNAQLWYSYTC